ncbi:transglutaminase N-terminal domain-containing protein, partial [Sphingomonas bacterium]|uniref:transglutaminase N-terminal domain-containing protein n=1 Tax=Sphingomonas bacterium TaxID=1895847 RepID=UPI00266F51A2
MRIAVDHRTAFRFTSPQTRLVQLLRVTPANNHDQTVARWTIHVDRDARMRDGTDGFGNVVTMLYADGPLDAIAIEVTGEVVTSHSDGVLHGAVETLPPAFFLRDTALTPRDPGIAEWAREVAGGRERLAALHALNERLHMAGAIDDRRGV